MPDAASASRKTWLGLLRSGLMLMRKERLAAGLLLAAALGPAFAQPGTEANSAVDGSSDGSLQPWRPMAVIHREDIEMSGVTHLDELISNWGAENGFGLNRPQTLGYTTLLNGRYQAPPLDLLPLSAVERIEIIGSGAAALDDGIASLGAINIVLRRDYEGFEVTATGGLPQAPGAATGHGSIIWGGKAGRGHLVVGFDSVHQGKIRSADRDHSRSTWSEGGRFADATAVSTGGNTVYFYDQGRTVARSLGDCPTDLGYTGVLLNPGSISGEGCGFPYGNIAWETSRRDRQSVVVNFDHPLGDVASLYVDGRMAWNEDLFRFAPSVGSFTVNNPTPELLEAAGAEAGPLTINHRFLAHGNRDWIENQEMHDLVFGLQGQFRPSINWDLSVNHFRNTENETGNTFVSEPLAVAAIVAGDYDIVNPLSTDPDHLAAVDNMSVSLDRELVSDVTTVRAALDGPGFALPGGRMRWMTGFEISGEEGRNVGEYRDRSGRIVRLEDVLGTGGSFYKGQRSWRSGFAEVQLPPLPRWNVLLAATSHDYDGDMETTGTLQVASSWQANEKLTLHGAWSSGSVAPSLSSLYALDSLTHPYACDTTNHSGPAAECDRAQYKTINSGNPDLKPGNTWGLTLGGTADVWGSSLNLDWFKTGNFNAPGRRSIQTILDQEAEDGSSILVTREDGVITEINNPLVNNGESMTAGFSLSGSTDWQLGPWTSGLDVHWAYITDSESKVEGVVVPGDFSRHRAHATLRVGQGDVTAAWHTRFISGYENTRETATFSPWIGHNLTLEWQNAFATEGLVLQGGVINLADRGPSVDPADPDNVDTRADAVRGRTFFLRAKLAW